MRLTAKIMLTLSAGIPLMASANLTINIQQGVDKPYPIAVVPFQQTAISNVITNDLGNSGRFDLLNPDKMPGKPHTQKAIRWHAWQKAAPGTEYVLVGNVSKSGSGYNVTYALGSLYSERILYGQKFHDVPKAKLRALSHFIADKV